MLLILQTEFMAIYKVSTNPIFPIKSYKSLYLKNGPIKIYKVLYFCPFSIANLYFFIEITKKTGYKHALYVINRKAINEDLSIFLTFWCRVDEIKNHVKILISLKKLVWIEEPSSKPCLVHNFEKQVVSVIWRKKSKHILIETSYFFEHPKSELYNF